LAKRGRKRKEGPRDKSGRLLQPGKFTPPPEHIAKLRQVFSFVTPSKGPDGRTGEIDQDICDGIGQLHALGMLDNQPIDALELRNIGREWRNGYLIAMKPCAYRTQKFERQDKGKHESQYTGADERWDRMDSALTGFDRSALYDLLVEPEIGSWPMGERFAPWVRGVIHDQLGRRKRLPPDTFVHLSANDYFLLESAIRGLFVLYDASLPGRFERRAA
jgi:hypothetical protein